MARRPVRSRQSRIPAAPRRDAGRFERHEPVFEVVGKHARGKTCVAIQGVIAQGEEIITGRPCGIDDACTVCWTRQPVSPGQLASQTDDAVDDGEVVFERWSTSNSRRRSDASRDYTFLNSLTSIWRRRGGLSGLVRFRYDDPGRRHCATDCSLGFRTGADSALSGDWGTVAWLGWFFLVIFGSLIGYTTFMRLLRTSAHAAPGAMPSFRP